ncbi:MAG: archaeosortase H [Promethearchaeota archaeon]
MGKIEYEKNYYDFDWLSVIILFVGAPILALTVWFSHDWIWLHHITAEFTKYLLNFITGTNSVVLFNSSANFATTPYYFQIDDVNNLGLGRIYFESLCTGVHAIAIFTAVILCIPSSSDPEIKRTIWMRKFWAILVTTIIFYLVNVLRMILQLYLYQNGSDWDDIHYPISSASSFIAVACVLVMHKFVPEFIMLLIWMGDEIKAMRRKPEDDLDPLPNSVPEESELVDSDTVFGEHAGYRSQK